MLLLLMVLGCSSTIHGRINKFKSNLMDTKDAKENQNSKGQSEQFQILPIQ